MLRELEYWVVSNLKGNENCIVFWNDNFSLAILLIAQQLALKGGSLLLLTDPRHPEAPLEAFKLTLSGMDLQEAVSWGFSTEKNEGMNSSDLIIASAELLHRNNKRLIDFSGL